LGGWSKLFVTPTKMSARRQARDAHLVGCLVLPVTFSYRFSLLLFSLVSFWLPRTVTPDQFLEVFGVAVIPKNIGTPLARPAQIYLNAINLPRRQEKSLFIPVILAKIIARCPPLPNRSSRP